MVSHSYIDGSTPLPTLAPPRGHMQLGQSCVQQVSLKQLDAQVKVWTSLTSVRRRKQSTSPARMRFSKALTAEMVVVVVWLTDSCEQQEPTPSFGLCTHVHTYAHILIDITQSIG